MGTSKKIRDKNSKHGGFKRLHGVLCIYVIAVSLVFCVTLNSGRCSVTDPSTCSWDTFSLIVLPCPSFM